MPGKEIKYYVGAIIAHYVDKVRAFNTVLLIYVRAEYVCDVQGTSYACECMEGFSGANCSANVDECAQHLCQNGATCVDGIAAYTCLCAADFSGRFCEVLFK
jgi:hypothetical protein